MSNHPNAMLLLVLTPDTLTRKTYRAIMAEEDKEELGDVTIGDCSYQCFVMEEDYNADHEVRAPEGSIVLKDWVTFGYGQSIEWQTLVERKEALDVWAKSACEKYQCSYKIQIGADYA